MPPISRIGKTGKGVRDVGDSLLEVLLAVAILGGVVISVALWTANATLWVQGDRGEAQALAYAKTGVELVRQQALASYQAGQGLPAVAPPVLPAVDGIAYQEQINGPSVPSWDNNSAVVRVREYQVVVTWTPSGAGTPDQVRLTTVVDPAVANL